MVRRGEFKMRILRSGLILLAFSTPAIAESNQYYDYLQRKNDEKAARVKAYRQSFVDQKALCAKIGGVRIGLNAEGVLKSCWGKPRKINVTTTAAGRTEQWVYNDEYLYFTDGLVSAIQNSR